MTARIAAPASPPGDVSAWRVKDLESYVGGLSNPSKMPGYGYSLPAAECKTGTKLRGVEGSTCSGCYAMKGRYAFRNVSDALYRRLASLELELWPEAMAELISRKGGEYFRWHDSGDIQSLAHLERIVRVCELTPAVKHWLPTREYRIVQSYLARYGRFPANLNVRLSAHMIGGHVPTFPKLAGLVTVSTVSRAGESGGHHCPAPQQGNSCGSCRACWSPDVGHVDYHLH